MLTAWARLIVAAEHSDRPMWLNLPSFLSSTRVFMISSMVKDLSIRQGWKTSIFFVPRKAAMHLSTERRKCSGLTGG